jgi:hypothetical protein
MDHKQTVDRCPACGGPLETRELGCPQCELTLRGRFPRCEFCALPEEQLNFLRLFVSRRGNLRELERELGVSYPTVRARLDDLLRALGYAVSAPSVQERQEQRRQVIEKLKAGGLTPEEAATKLRKLEG